jgi:hypothetical protein
MPVEGVVGDVACAARKCTLRFAPTDPTALTVTILWSLISRAPADPVRVYSGARVRATGVIQGAAGRPEMILRGAGQIDVLDAVENPPPAAADSNAAPAPTPTPKEGPCDAARTRRRDLGPHVEPALAAVATCAGRAQDCRREIAALRVILERLEEMDAAVAAACP